MPRKKNRLNYIFESHIRVEARINYDKDRIEQTDSAYYVRMVLVKKVSEFNKSRKTAVYYEKTYLKEELPLSNPTTSRAIIKVKKYLRKHRYGNSLPIEIYGRHSSKKDLAEKVTSHPVSSRPLDIG